uniref:Proteasome activator PA28 C-terminal domain-containing protein n=1 Tax=Glossina brevipalpis TaxID=37001 RepID=A0A1A9WWH7_9MUSC
MSSETNAKLQDYKGSLIKQAEQLVREVFPEKIIQLNELLATPMFTFADQNIPVNFDGSSDTDNQLICIPRNTSLCEMIEIVKPIIRKLLEESNFLKMWISFMIPKVEDGGNFGVSIQEDTLAEVENVESEGVVFFEQISDYFLLRANIVAKVTKYPQINDYRRAVVELDEKEYMSLWQTVTEIRNQYSKLHDIIIKNMEKLKKPRSSNPEQFC